MCPRSSDDHDPPIAAIGPYILECQNVFYRQRCCGRRSEHLLRLHRNTRLHTGWGAFVRPEPLGFEGRLSLGPISAVGSFDNTVTEWRDVTQMEVFVTVEWVI